jgi:putative endonuclease
MLRCADGSVYAGWTNDLEARLAAHNDGSGSKYTRSRRPVALAYCEPFPSKAEAMRREAQLKRLTRSQKLALIGAARISGGPISES